MRATEPGWCRCCAQQYEAGSDVRRIGASWTLVAHLERSRPKPDPCEVGRTNILRGLSQ